MIVTQQRNRIHPHKFTMWIAIGSIVMMFAGLTSAYLVKSGATGWVGMALPTAFKISTALILLSSVTIYLAQKNFKAREMVKSRALLLITLALGIAFVVFQWIGFKEMWNHQIRMNGAGKGQFAYVIFGLHALHVLGGIVALCILVIKQYLGKIRNYNSTSIEVMSTYWHFVDFLWIYLLVFFILMG